MTQIVRSQPSTAKLQEALAAFKRASQERRLLREGTEEYTRALDAEEGLMHEVYELASAMKRPPD